MNFHISYFGTFSNFLREKDLDAVNISFSKVVNRATESAFRFVKNKVLICNADNVLG